MIKTTGIILAGGKSRRMGEDKGLMLLDGKPMIQYVLDVVSCLTPNIVIIANDKKYEQFGYPVYSDDVINSGPLAGIVKGLSVSETDFNWILSCDTPYIRTEVLIELMDHIEDVDAVVWRQKNKMHPLIASYCKSALNPLKEQLALNKFRLIDALKQIKVKELDGDRFDSKIFKNLNSKTDL